MQVFEDDNGWLIQAFPDNDALDRIQSTLAPDQRVHLRQRIRALLDSKQSPQIRQSVAGCRIERCDSRTDFLASCGRIINVLNTNMAPKQFEHWQPCRGLAVRD